MVRRITMLALLTLAGTAMAQDGGIESALQKAATASPSEMRSFATESVETVKENAKVVARLTEQARSKGEYKIQNCLAPKNTSAQALVQVTELSAGNLSRALDEGGDDATAKARHEYRKIAVSLNKSESIRADAQQCQDGEGDGQQDGVVIWDGGVGDDQDVVDDNPIDDFDVQVDAPSVSTFEP